MDPRTTSAGPRELGLLLLLPFGLALLMFGWSLGGGFLSDDLLLGFLRNPDGSPLWSEGFRDFARPWLGLEGAALYRPLVSLSYCLDLSIGHGAASPFHLSNLLLHSLSTFAAAWIVAEFFKAKRRLAFVVTALVFGLSPAATEATVWISGRVSTLELCFRLFACLAFVRLCRRPTVLRYVLTAVLSLAALLSKESAILLPLSFFVLDVLARPDASLRDRIRRQLSFVPIWALYALLRYLALGALIGDAAPGGGVEAGIGSNFLSKLLALFAPLPPSLDLLLPLVGIFWLLLFTFLVRAAGGRSTLFLLLAWTFLHFVPSYALQVDDALAGSRLVYGAVFPLALLLTSCLLLPPPRTRLPASLLAALILALFAGRQIERSLAYRSAFAEVDKIQQGLAQLGAAAIEKLPLGLLHTPTKHEGVPCLNPNGVFPLLQPPFTPAVIPGIGLQCTLESFRDSEALFRDAAVLRAVLEAEIPLLDWQEGRFALHTKPASRASLGQPLPGKEIAQQPGSFLYELESKIACSSFEAVTLELDPQVRSLSFEVLGANGAAGGAALFTRELSFEPQAFDHTRRLVHLDLSHEIALLAGGATRGFRLRLKGSDAGPASLRILSRVTEIPLRETLEGRTLELRDEGFALKTPASPSREARLALVLLGPHAGHRIEIPEDGAPAQQVQIPARLVSILRSILRVSQQKSFRYYFEARDGTRSWRSRLDWFRFATEAR